LRWLRASPDKILFSTGHLSTVVGLSLSDGQQVVIKARNSANRILGCIQVQEYLSKSGFPCPKPLAGPHPMGEMWATAESLVPGGEQLAPGSDSPRLFAVALADLVRRAPLVSAVSSLDPPPAWVHWNHHKHGVWPDPDDIEKDLNQFPGPEGLDQAASQVRRVLLACNLPLKIGHADWEAPNVLWLNRQIHVVHDWDSVVALPEPQMAGVAAAVLPGVAGPGQATIAETESFLHSYQEAREVRWGRGELHQAWAAGLWIRAFNAKKEVVRGGNPVALENIIREIPERLRRVND
jgi:hypothetical protein